MRVALVFFVLLVSHAILAATMSVADVYKTAKEGATVTIKGTVMGIGGWFANVHDGTDGIPVYSRTSYTFCQIGDVLEITGVLRFIAKRYRLNLTHVQKVGTDPNATRTILLSPAELASSRNLDYRTVTVAGVVCDAFRDEFDPEWVLLYLSPLHVHAAALLHDPTRTIDPTTFIDTEIRFTGNFIHRDDGGRPHLGPHVISFFTNSVVQSKAAPVNPFAVPPYFIRTDGERTRSGATDDGHRRRLTGTVLATWNGNSFFLKTEQDLRVRVHLMTGLVPPTPGSRVTISGFPCHDVFFTEFVNALYRTENPLVVADETPVDVTPDDLLSDDLRQRKLKYQMDGHLIRLRGRVISIAASDGNRHILNLLCENDTIKVEANELPTPPVDAMIEITGVCRFTRSDEDGMVNSPRLSGFTVLLRMPDDIRVLRNPPWWTPVRTVIALSVLLLLIVAGTVWNFFLQKLVTRKGRELARESLAHLKAELRTDERMALAVELHDTIAQNLTGVSMQFEGVETAHRESSPRLGDLITKARRALDSCCVELRNCLWDLRNDAFDCDDISDTVRKAVNPHLQGATAEVSLDLPRSRISDSTLHALLCIVRELVINAVKHGHATHIDIRGEMTTEGVRISVKDNGCGFDPAARPGPAGGHFGLLGIQERLDRLGGTLNITSSPGNGATFTITI